MKADIRMNKRQYRKEKEIRKAGVVKELPSFIRIKIRKRAKEQGFSNRRAES